MTPDIETLERVAREAEIDWESALESGVPTPEGWAYIAAAHPQAILSLCARVREMEGLLQKTRQFVQYAHSITDAPGAATHSPVLHEVTVKLLTDLDATVGDDNG